MIFGMLSQGLLLEFRVLDQAGPIGPVVGACSPTEQRRMVAGWTQMKAKGKGPRREEAAVRVPGVTPRQKDE